MSIPSNNTNYCGPIGGGWQLAVDYCSPLTACPSGTPAECGNGWTCYSGIECEVEENFDGDQYVAPSVDFQSETNSVPTTAEILYHESSTGRIDEPVTTYSGGEVPVAVTGSVQVHSEAATEFHSEQNASPPVTNGEDVDHGPTLPVINAPGVSFGSGGDSTAYEDTPVESTSASQSVNEESTSEGASRPGGDCYCGYKADVAVQVVRADHSTDHDCSHLRKCVNGSCPYGQMVFHGINCDEKNDHQLESTSQTPDLVGSAESNESEAPASVEKNEANISNNPSQVVGEPGQTSQVASSGQPSPISSGSIPSPNDTSTEISTPQVGSDQSSSVPIHSTDEESADASLEQTEVENTFFCGSTDAGGWLEAAELCIPCPDGDPTPCGGGRTCYSGVTCNKPKPKPVIMEGARLQIGYCGTSFYDSKENCAKRRPCTFDKDCDAFHPQCFASTCEELAQPSNLSPGSVSYDGQITILDAFCGAWYEETSSQCSNRPPCQTAQDCNQHGHQGCFSDISCTFEKDSDQFENYMAHREHVKSQHNSTGNVRPPPAEPAFYEIDFSPRSSSLRLTRWAMTTAMSTLAIIMCL